MIRSITRQKPLEEIIELLNGSSRVFVVGCGTCPTLCRTGGMPEVIDMAVKLRGQSRFVTGTLVIPVACDEISHEALEENREAIREAEVLLVMACAYGVQTVARQVPHRVVPALDTLFVGKETGLGRFDEVCNQCGECVLGLTAGICPITACHKGLLNGPCGGTNQGKCEIDPEKDCAWTLIYMRLKELGKLDLMRRYRPPRNHNVVPKPGKASIPL